MLEAAFFCTPSKPIEGVAYIAYKHAMEVAPKKTGYMASCMNYDYDETIRIIYLTNDCEYGEYQNELISAKGNLGGNVGWFQEAVQEGFEYALTVVEDREEKDWFMFFEEE